MAYSVRMTGEFNVRNAAMAAAAASFAGLSAEEIRAGLEDFEGVARRQELRGEVNGIKVIDDFAHHPTAIRLAVQSLRQSHPDARLWILFEPRSNTTRRAVFQNELAEALATRRFRGRRRHAGPPQDPGKRPARSRRNSPPTSPASAAAVSICRTSKPSSPRSRPTPIPGDVIAVLCNGGFGGIHGKLLAALE